MDIEKLIERLKEPDCDECTYEEKRECAGSAKCVLSGYAAEALSTLQAENEKLRADVVRFNDMLASYQNVLVPELRVELEQVKAERDAAVERIREWEKFDTYLFVHNFITPEKWRGPGKEN